MILRDLKEYCEDYCEKCKEKLDKKEKLNDKS